MLPPSPSTTALHSAFLKAYTPTMDKFEGYTQFPSPRTMPNSKNVVTFSARIKKKSPGGIKTLAHAQSNASPNTASVSTKASQDGLPYRKVRAHKHLDPVPKRSGFTSEKGRQNLL